MGLIKKDALRRPQIVVELMEDCKNAESAARYYAAKIAEFSDAIESDKSTYEDDDGNISPEDRELLIAKHCPWIFERRAKSKITNKMEGTGEIFVCIRLHQMPVFLDIQVLETKSQINIYDTDGSTIAESIEREDVIGMSDMRVASYEEGWTFLKDFMSQENADEYDEIIKRAAEGKRVQDEEEKPNMKRRILWRYEKYKQENPSDTASWGEMDTKDNPSGTGRSPEKQKQITMITNSVRNETGYARFYERVGAAPASLD